jgi:predicted GNAT superfamily acetyltransferase
VAGIEMIGELQLRRDGRQIAELHFAENEDNFSLDLVLVAAAERGSGLGTELIRRLFILADAAGKPIVTTARPIGSSSPAALARLERYYLRLGFEATRRGVSSVDMQRPPERRAAGEPPLVAQAP